MPQTAVKCTCVQNSVTLDLQDGNLLQNAVRA